MPFQPGVSGNPSGRPKSDDYLKGLAKTHSLEALDKLVEWMRSDNAKASVAACSIILDRGYGKPLQQVEVKKLDPFDEITPDDITRIRDRLNGRGAITLDQTPGQSLEVQKIGDVQTVHKATRIP